MIKSYGSYFVSYLLDQMQELSNIKNIILFGSVAMGKATKESDVDIFIELKKENKAIKKKIELILDKFYKSREALIFKNKGIDNKISLVIGKLENWPDLKKSIEGTGILFYGAYIATGVAGKKHILISWDKIGKNRGAFLNKLYGFTVKGKRYKGLIEQLNGRKIGKSSLMVPIESHKDILEILKKYKVNAKVMEVWYEE